MFQSVGRAGRGRNGSPGDHEGIGRSGGTISVTPSRARSSRCASAHPHDRADSQESETKKGRRGSVGSERSRGKHDDRRCKNGRVNSLRVHPETPFRNSVMSLSLSYRAAALSSCPCCASTGRCAALALRRRTALALERGSAGGCGLRRRPRFLPGGLGECPRPLLGAIGRAEQTDCVLHGARQCHSRRGSAQPARASRFEGRSGERCQGRWSEVGPLPESLDVADILQQEPFARRSSRPWRPYVEGEGIRPAAPARRASAAQPLPRATRPAVPYYFAARAGVGCENLGTRSRRARSGAEQGFASRSSRRSGARRVVGPDEEETMERAARARPRAPVPFHGELVPAGKLDVGWINVEKASVLASRRRTGQRTRTRFERCTLRGRRVPSETDVGVEDGW